MGRPLFDALEGGAVLITANTRLSRWLREAYGRHRRERGDTVWPTPEVLPLSAWLRRCWEEVWEARLSGGGEGGNAAKEGEDGEGAQPPLLLSGVQAAVVWERVVAEDRTESKNLLGLLRPGAAAEHAARGWDMLREWGLALAPGDATTAEARAFLRWSRAFEEACAQGGWMAEALLPGVVTGWLGDGLGGGRLPAPARVLLAGFDESTPARARLWEALTAAGCAVEEVAGPAVASHQVRVEFPDAEAEIEAAARWARGLLERGETGSIGVVVPEIDAHRVRLTRVFREILTPGAVVLTTPPPGEEAGVTASAAPFNISKAPPLKEYSLVAAALALLGMEWELPPITELGRLLRSPFLAGAEAELQPRALLEARLRSFGRLKLPLATVLSTAAEERRHDRATSWHAPLLANRLGAWRETFQTLWGQRQSPAAWARDFAGLLHTLGWPGERTLDSTEFQTREKFDELLSGLAALEPVLPRAGFGEALAQLNRLAGETPFQPETQASRATPQVQILGHLEAGGLEFSHLWLLGVHDGVWPPPPSPNPFLPTDWQRRHGLPQSSAQRELAYARRATVRLLSAAPAVTVSWPAMEEDRPLRPSPLIAGLPQLGVDGLALSAVPGLWEAAGRGGELETLPDHTAPPLAVGEAARGGSALFKDQGDCPFRAFARHRLGAEPLEEPEYGIDARGRGILVHQAMERLWAHLVSLEKLRALSQGALQTLVEEVAREVVEDFPAVRAGAMGARFAAIERARIVRLTLAGLEQELGREPFSVKEREQEKTFTIGGIEVNTRIDRIDEVPGVGEVVIDYKTGKANVGHWFGERPEEPQLPLYCSSGEISVAGVAFFQLRAGETRFQGLESRPGLFPGATGWGKIPAPLGRPAPADLPALVEEWKVNLARLAENFRKGDARVDPRQPAQTCRYCELPLLCRIQGWEGPEAEETGGEADG